MSQMPNQDHEELIRQTIARLEQLAPVLRWPRVAYQAKLNPYGSFYATFYDTTSNRRVDNCQAGPSIAQPGSVSPALWGAGSSTSEQPGPSVRTTSPAPSQHNTSGDGLQRQSHSTSPTQQQQRKGPRGFNIPRPVVRRSTMPADQEGPSPVGSQQLVQSPDGQHPLTELEPSQQYRGQLQVEADECGESHQSQLHGIDTELASELVKSRTLSEASPPPSSEESLGGTPREFGRPRSCTVMQIDEGLHKDAGVSEAVRVPATNAAGALPDDVQAKDLPGLVTGQTHELLIKEDGDGDGADLPIRERAPQAADVAQGADTVLDGFLRTNVGPSRLEGAGASAAADDVNGIVLAVSVHDTPYVHSVNAAVLPALCLAGADSSSPAATAPLEAQLEAAAAGLKLEGDATAQLAGMPRPQPVHAGIIAPVPLTQAIVEVSPRSPGLRGLVQGQLKPPAMAGTPEDYRCTSDCLDTAVVNVAKQLQRPPELIPEVGNTHMPHTDEATPKAALWADMAVCQRLPEEGEAAVGQTSLCTERNQGGHVVCVPGVSKRTSAASGDMLGAAAEELGALGALPGVRKTVSSTTEASADAAIASPPPAFMAVASAHAAVAAAAADAHAMPPPSTHPQLRLEVPQAAPAGRPHAVPPASRRTSNVSLQTLESGELPSLDTPVGGTPSSTLQPVSVLGSGVQRMRSFTLLQNASRGRHGRSAGGLDVMPAESGELQAVSGDLQPQTAAGLADAEGQESREPGPEEGIAEGQMRTADCGANGSGNLYPQLSSQSRSLDASRRHRWGNPVHAASGGAGSTGAQSGGADVSSAGVSCTALGGLVDLSMAKGLMARMSTHGSLQDVVPNAHTMGPATVAAAAGVQPANQHSSPQQPPNQVRRRSRSPHPTDDCQDVRASKERQFAPSGTVDGLVVEAGAGGRRSSLVPGPSSRSSRSRSRSRERRRYSRSPRRRGSRSHSKSRSPHKELRGKRGHDRDYDRCRGRDRDRERERHGARDRERDRDRDRDLERRVGDRHDRYDSYRIRDYSRASDRARDSRDGRVEPKGDRGVCGGSGSARHGGEQQQQRDRRLPASADGRSAARRVAGEVESESAGSYPHKRPNRGVSQQRPLGSGSRGVSGSDMDLDDSDMEGPSQHRPAMPTAPQAPDAGGIAQVHPPPLAASVAVLAGASGRTVVPGAAAEAPARQHARPITATCAGSSAHSPSSVGYHSPGRGTGGTSPGRAQRQQHHRSSSPSQRPIGIGASAGGPGAVRSLGSSRRPFGTQAQAATSSQQHKPIALQGKAERALAKLQQDRGRPQHPGASSGTGGHGPPLSAPKSSAREQAKDSTGAAPGSVGAVGGAAVTGGGSVLYDADAALDPPGCVRVGDDAPLSAGMEPDLLGFMALSMIQFSCAYMVESPRSLFNKAHIKALADEGRTLRRKADSNREANGNRWNALLLTLYLQSALKSMESAYGHEQVGQEREVGMRSSSDLLSTASQVLVVVSHEANRLASQLQRPQPNGAAVTASHGAEASKSDGAPGAPKYTRQQASGEAPMATPPKPIGVHAVGAGSNAAPTTPPPPPAADPASPINSLRSVGLETPSALGSRTPQHLGAGSTPVGPLAVSVTFTNAVGLAASPESLVLEAIRLLALKLTAICRTRWLLLNQESLAQALKHHEPSPSNGVGPLATGGGGPAAGSGDDGGAGTSGRRTSPTAAADSASSTLEAAALSGSTYTASVQQMAESVQAFMGAADAWRRAAFEARAFNQAVSAAGVEHTAVVAAARIGSLGYEGGVWDLMGSVNLARKALDSITGML